MPDERANDVNNVTGDDVKKPICGIIMPISATINHTAAHWIDVRTLISRAIEKADFVAAPVWENSSIDRVSERIIGNIFQFDLAIADISDSNPNVMLELGLRLASKKPTIVIINAGGNIPFDIRDFHALEYPASLSMLEMETFIDTLAKTLTAKHAASQEEGYTPFLGKVVVDVVQPGERELPLEKYVMNRLDEISAKINQQLPSFRPTSNSHPERDRTVSISDPSGTTFYFELPSGSRSTLNNKLSALGISSDIDMIGGVDDNMYYSVAMPDIFDEKAKKAISRTIDNLVSSLGGTMGIPSDIFKILRRANL